MRKIIITATLFFGVFVHAQSQRDGQDAKAAGRPSAQAKLLMFA
jgi:hypothetical protein